MIRNLRDSGFKVSDIERKINRNETRRAECRLLRHEEAVWSGVKDEETIEDQEQTLEEDLAKVDEKMICS